MSSILGIVFLSLILVNTAVAKSKKMIMVILDDDNPELSSKSDIGVRYYISGANNDKNKVLGEVKLGFYKFKQSSNPCDGEVEEVEGKKDKSVYYYKIPNGGLYYIRPQVKKLDGQCLGPILVKN